MLPKNSLGLKVEKKVVNLRVWPNIQGDRAMFREVIRSVPDLVKQNFLYPLKAYIKRNKESSVCN